MEIARHAINLVSGAQAKRVKYFGVPAGLLMGKHLSYTEEMEGGLRGDVR